MMCHSGNYEHVIDTMFSKARHFFRHEYPPDLDDAGFLKGIVYRHVDTIQRVKNLKVEKDESTVRPKELARHRWTMTILSYELEVYKGWESFSVKKLAKTQVDVDLKRLTIPHQFNMLKFRTFFRAMEDDWTLSLAQKRRVLQYMDGGIILCAIRKEKLVEKEFTKSWPTRKQLVKAGFLSNRGYEPVHMFNVLRMHLTAELFAYMAPKIQAFMHDMRGSKCMFDINYDALSGHLLNVPILPQRY
jgi:hypothetical protein